MVLILPAVKYPSAFHSLSMYYVYIIIIITRKLSLVLNVLIIRLYDSASRQYVYMLRSSKTSCKICLLYGFPWDFLSHILINLDDGWFKVNGGGDGGIVVDEIANVLVRCNNNAVWLCRVKSL